MNVLSLFDGMSCGQIALDQLGIKVDNYYAAEIDKYAIEIAKKNYPNTIHLGDVTKIKGEDLPQIDLLIGGSPCQGFSFAGKQLNFDDPRSALFFEYVRLLKECKPKYFLLENVRMKQEYEDVISNYLGASPIKINSSLVSAQNRVRLYWSNIPNITQPKDRGIRLIDIFESDVDEKIYEAPYYKRYDKDDGCIGYIGKQPKQATRVYSTNNKSQCITALGGGQGGKTGLYELPISGAIRGRQITPNSKEYTQMLELREDNKTNTLTTATKDNVIFHNSKCRKLTPTECEKLQTVPDGYTEGVSNSQRYKMLGNGWTVEVIKHIFKNMEV
jgi:site-specific DNA-cytosine methylase